MIQVPISEAKDQLDSLLQQAASGEVILTSNGKPVGALIGFASDDDWFDFQLEHDPRFLNQIAVARAQAMAGKTTRIENLPSVPLNEP